MPRTWGWPKHAEDFGQTLAKRGIPSGPYVLFSLCWVPVRPDA
ncbi:MlaA family lipoprotein [Candidatus Methylospira mobilis]|nr:MlaA family lipoprotein [Candidatus Methylospira mobilis]